MATRSNRFSSRRARPRRNSSSSRRTISRSRRASNGGRPWSGQELAFLRKFYRTQSTSWVARQLGRTVYSVRYKASDLSIKKANPSVWKNNSNTSSRRGTASKTRWAASSRRRATRTSRSRRSARGRR